MKSVIHPLLLCVAVLVSLRTQAQPELRETLKDNVGAHWIYDEFNVAVAQGQATGKPLLVLFRCVP